MQAESESPDKRKLYYILVHDFFEALFDNRLGYYASSLSWSTLFAIIPILVILLAVFTSMPLFNALYEQVHSWLFENFLPTDSKEIMGYIDEFVANSGKLGMMGVAYVLIAAIMFFKDYDYVVNDIFETKKRTVWEALKTYTGLIIIVPMMLGSGRLRPAFSRGNAEPHFVWSDLDSGTTLSLLSLSLCPKYSIVAAHREKSPRRYRSRERKKAGC